MTLQHLKVNYGEFELPTLPEFDPGDNLLYVHPGFIELHEWIDEEKQEERFLINVDHILMLSPAPEEAPYNTILRVHWSHCPRFLKEDLETVIARIHLEAQIGCY